jgi:hypothetical protein
MQFYPSSYYRYITVEKVIQDHGSEVNDSLSEEILSSTDWWDGREWHRDDPFSSNSVNRFQQNFSTLYSVIIDPDVPLLSVCLGNPGIPVWGTKSPGLTGAYVTVPVGKTPESLVYQLRSEADRLMWSAVRDVNYTSPSEREQWSSLEREYWEGVWWHNRGILEQNQNLKMLALGRSATYFSRVISLARITEKG